MKSRRPPKRALAHILPGLHPLAVEVADLNIDPENARRHGPRDIEAIKDSLEELGQHRPIVVQAEGMTVRVGNGTLLAARDLGWRWIAALVVEEDRMTAIRRSILDNRTAELSAWDPDYLIPLLDEAAAAGFDPASFGWEEGEVEALLGALDAAQGEPLPEPDPPPLPTPVPKAPRPFGGIEGVDLRLGDSADILPDLPKGSFDAMVTDPPAGIAFMDKDWDRDKGGRDQWVRWLSGVFRLCRRVLKPGAHTLIWALPRTSHWTATALEDGGFEIRDVVSHHFGSGFPKGNGTLKPATEHWILARAPMGATLEETLRKYGTGALDIDGCRVGTEVRFNPPAHNRGDEPASVGPVNVTGYRGRKAAGRWPANLVLSHALGCSDESCSVGCPVAALDLQAGGRDGAARFFYVQKAAKPERDLGLDAENDHPTVKSIGLMRWLVRLVTPAGGKVLDPFSGSGSTGIAALLEGCGFCGIEQDERYLEVSKARISAAVEAARES